MRKAAVAVGGIGFALGGLLAVFAVGMRTGSPVVLDAVRRFNRGFTNRLQMRTAGTPGAYASIVRHRGRRSGQEYETPVVALPTDAGFVFALPYGRRTDWMRNVLAAGSATVVHEGRSYQVDSPELLGMAEANPYFPPREQRLHRAFRVNDFLRVHQVGGPHVDPATVTR